MRVTDFVSEIKREENYPNFEKSMRAIQHDLLGLKISTVSQRQQTNLPVVIFCRSGLVA